MKEDYKGWKVRPLQYIKITEMILAEIMENRRYSTFGNVGAEYEIYILTNDCTVASNHIADIYKVKPETILSVMSGKPLNTDIKEYVQLLHNYICSSGKDFEIFDRILKDTSKENEYGILKAILNVNKKLAEWSEKQNN